MFLDLFFNVMILDLVAKKEKTSKAQKAEVLSPCGHPELGLQGGARQCPGDWQCAGPGLSASRKCSLQLPDPRE